jgi:hypothetical protein
MRKQINPDRDGFVVKPGRQRKMKRKWKKPGKKAQNGGPRKRKHDIPLQGTE